MLNKFAGDPEREPSDVEFEFLCRGPMMATRSFSSTPREASDLETGLGLDVDQSKGLQGLCLLPAFHSLLSNIQGNIPTWKVFFSSPNPESSVPDFEVISSGKKSLSVRLLPPERRSFYELLIIRALRLDRLVASLENYIGNIFGSNFPWRGLFDLEEVTLHQGSAASPLLLCSEPGHDASGKVDALADKLKKKMKSVAMGSEEGFEIAEKIISEASKEGTWVLLRNIHLCPTWLEALEKRLHNLIPDKDFRLFLTSEIHPKLPSSLLRLSNIMVVAAPTGVKANVFRLLSSISQQRMQSTPVEKGRLYFLVTWFHAIVQERLRYVPLGWTKRYEFSAADAEAAYDVVDDWIGQVAGTKSHISPEQIPWEALRTTLSQSIYGGRIDNQYDQKILDSFLQAFFDPKCFDVDFPLAVDVGESGSVKSLVTIPDDSTQSGYLAWLEILPNRNPLTWLGLVPAVEAHILRAAGMSIVAKVMRIQEVYGVEEEETEKDKGKAEGSEGSKVGGMFKVLLKDIESWVALLGSSWQESKDVGGRKDLSILQRCLSREADVAKGLLSMVSMDLSQAVDYIKGSKKATKDVKSLVSLLATNVVPQSWQTRYVGLKGLGAGMLPY